MNAKKKSTIPDQKKSKNSKKIAQNKSIKSDIKRLDSMKDSDIDYSDAPSLDQSFFTKSTVKLPLRKDSVTLRIDHDVLEYFKHQGKGYQTLINAVLKMYVNAKK